MWEISEGICFLIMLALSIKDLLERKVSLYLLVVAGISGLVYQAIIREMDVWLLLGGVLVGITFIIISKVTEEGIGYGDSIGILVLGIFLGFWRILTVVSIAFFLLLFVLIPVLCKKRMSGKATLPFYPFLTGGYLCLMMIENM